MLPVCLTYESFFGILVDKGGYDIHFRPTPQMRHQDTVVSDINKRTASD
jgi:hypothetical protein